MYFGKKRRKQTTTNNYAELQNRSFSMGGRCSKQMGFCIEAESSEFCGVKVLSWNHTQPSTVTDLGRAQ